VDGGNKSGHGGRVWMARGKQKRRRLKAPPLFSFQIDDC
jgi:hypothetical protein